MTTISQTIQDYTGGLSQQPDERKLPGQLKQANNVLPDITRGLTKRPGTKLVASLTDGTNPTQNSALEGRWFHYYRDKTEQYIGQIDRLGVVKMWRCSDGVEMHVETDATKATQLVSYLTHSDDADLQPLTLNDYTYITNRTKTASMTTSTTAAKPAEAFVELKKVAYASQYALNLYEGTTLSTVKTATRISVEPINEGDDSYCPNVDTKIFNINGVPEVQKITTVVVANSETYRITDGTTTIDFATDGSATMAELIFGFRDHEDYDKLKFTISLQDTDDWRLNFKEAGTQTLADTVFTKDVGGSPSTPTVSRLTTGAASTTSTETGKRNLYFRLSTIGQAVPEPDSTTPKYKCRYTTTVDLLYGGEGWAAGDTFEVGMQECGYKITIDEISESKVQADLGLIRPTPTSFDGETTVTAENILGSLSTDIIAADANWDAWNESTVLDGVTGVGVKQIGNGIYIRRDDSTAFSISTPVGELLNVLTDEVADVADLPNQCRHGYIVKVRNSDAEEDDYYVKFEGNNSKDGKGSWTECPAPGRTTAFNPDTMPIQIVRQSSSTADKSGLHHPNGWFKISQVTWEDCGAGNTTTVPQPSFIDKTINKMLFWRNRLILLSGENVNMSRPGDFFNFWPKSAITYTSTDSIDISCSSEYPATIYDGIENNVGLVLFTENQQFLLSTDSDLLTPVTAKISALSSYHFNSSTNPVSLGTTIAFLDNAGKYSRLWEAQNIIREGEPIITDQTKVVSNLFDKDVNKVSNSRENSMVFFCKKDTSTLYVFRYFNSGQQRLLSSWFTWTFCGNIQHHAVIDDSLYLVLRNNLKDSLQKISLKVEADSVQVVDDLDTTDTADDITYTIHLDTSSSVTIPADAYDDDTALTTFTKPVGYESTCQLAVFDTNVGSGDSDPIGSYALANTSLGSCGGDIQIAGDWSDKTVVLGYLYDMEIKIPTIYRSTKIGERYISDTNSSLIIHRIILNFGEAGAYNTTLERVGKASYTEEWEAALSDGYRANQIAISNSSIQTIPVYEKNINVNISLKSSHPSPVTLHSMSWEGDYNDKYYQRV